MILVTQAPVVVVPDDTPPPLPAPPPADVHALSVTWTSYTGRVWELNDPASPVFMMAGGTGGLGPVSADHWWQDSPTLDGSSWDGMRTPRSEVFFPVFISAETSAGFLAEHHEFVSSLNGRQVGTLRVTRPDATWREQLCRYGSGMDAPMAIDPVLAGYASYVVTWATAEPFWRGEPVVESFPYYSGGNFFPGPPWNLAPGQILGEATVDNPGDVDAPPVWHIDGPFTGFSVGIGPAVAAGTITKNAGEWIEIDMHDNQLTVLDESGIDRWTSLTDANFVSIPPGPNGLDTTLIGAGAGSNVTLSFTPRYWSAL